MAFTYTGEKVDLGFGRGWLDKGAAASIKRIDKALGHPLQITEAGRNWEQQNAHFQHYLKYGSPIALSPDTPSIHQKGGAVDSNEAQRVHSLMEEHGFRRTVYRWVNGKWTLVEPWHYEYFPQYDLHINDPATPPILSKEDDMTTLNIKAGTNIYVFSPGQIKLGDNGPQIQRAKDAGIRQLDLAGTTAQVNELLGSWMNYFGVPQSVVCTDGVARQMLNGKGHVLNPETNKYESNGMWSWDRLNVALNRIIAKKKK